MQKRTAAAGTALVFAASVTGLAATSGSAHATTHHAAARAATTQTVKVTSELKGVRLSTHTIRPGKTLFKVYRGHGGGQMQLLRLKAGYSLQQAGKDFGAAFSGDVKAVRRVDRNVVFYGGINVPATGAKAPNVWGVNVDKRGTYYVINTGTKKNLPPTALSVRGTTRAGSLPKADGWLNMAQTKGVNRWVSPATDPHRGWMSTTNHALEPHFVDLHQVKESTTSQDVQDFINAGAQGNPSWGLPAGTGAGVISPGHTFVWKYSLPKGKYISMCFWPSKTNGMPHFLMGMYRLFHLG
jgi:hypothetical protein